VDAVLLGHRDDLAAHLERGVLVAQTAAEPEGRDARQRLVRVLQRAVNVIGPHLGEQPGRDRKIGVRLDTVQHRVAGDVLDEEGLLVAVFFFFLVAMAGRLAAEPILKLLLPFFELLLGDLIAEDEVVDVVAEVGDLAGRAAPAPPQREVESNRALGVERRIADFHRIGGVVQPEEIELVDGRGRAVAARLTAKVSRSLAASGVMSKPIDPDPVVNVASSRSVGVYFVRSSRPANCRLTCGQVISS
jgi:hypothetical protein